MKALSIERGKKRSKEDVIFGVVNYTLFAVFTLICVYPFYYLIINSLSANDLSGNGSINFLPRQLHLENYKQVLQLKGWQPRRLFPWQGRRLERYAPCSHQLFSGLCLRRKECGRGKSGTGCWWLPCILMRA